MLAVIVIAVYYFHDVLYNWFVYDDAAALLSSSESVLDILFKSTYSSAFYSPLLQLSIKPDFLLFALDPFPYHVHNLIILLVITYVFYRVLRLYTGEAPSFLGAALLLFSLPSFVMVSWITLRQYLYPVLFSLIAVYLVVKMHRDEKKTISSVLLVCILSELSFMGKEQFVTLPFVLFILSGGPLRKRIADTLPYFVVLVLHIALRALVLKGIGGYVGMSFYPKAYAASVMQSPLSGSEVLFGYPLVIVFLCLFILVRSPKRLFAILALWVIALAVQFLIIYPPAYDFSLRYWFVPALLIAATASIAVHQIGNTILRSAAVVILLVLFFMNTLRHGVEVKSFLKQKADLAQLVSRSMTDARYANALIIVDDYTLTDSGYLAAMDKIYKKMRMRTFPSFAPPNLLLYYPQIGDKRAIYATESSHLVNIANSLRKRSKNGLRNPALQAPTLKFADDLLSIACASNSQEISAYLITRSAGGANNFICSNPKVKYPGGIGIEVNVRNLFRNKSVKRVVLTDIAYEGNKGWQLAGHLLGPDENLLLLSCVAPDGRLSQLSPLDVQNK